MRKPGNSSLILPPDLSVSFPIEQTVNLFDFWRSVRIWSNQYAGVIIIDIVSSFLILCHHFWYCVIIIDIV